MSNRTSLLFVSALFFGLGCSSSDDATPAPTDTGVAPTDGGGTDATDGGTDGGTDAPTDGGSDAKNACESHGGQCIPLTATSKCPDGTASSSDSCTGVGSMCCEPVDSDAGGDAASDAAHD